MNIRRKTIIFSVAAALITVVLVVFAIYPLIKGIKEDSEELSSIKKEVALSKGEIGEIKQLQELLESLEEGSSKIEEMFIDAEVPIDIIQFWEKIAGEANLEITISPASIKEEKNERWEFISFQIQLSGSPENTLMFLEKLEKGPYFTEIENLTIKKLTERDIGPTESLTINDVRTTLLVKAFTNED